MRPHSMLVLGEHQAELESGASALRGLPSPGFFLTANLRSRGEPADGILKLCPCVQESSCPAALDCQWLCCLPPANNGKVGAAVGCPAVGAVRHDGDGHGGQQSLQR